MIQYQPISVILYNKTKSKHGCSRCIKSNFLLRKTFRGNLNDAISLAKLTSSWQSPSFSKSTGIRLWNSFEAMKLLHLDFNGKFSLKVNVRYAKSLFTNIQKTIEYVLKISLLFKNLQTSRKNNSRFLKIKNANILRVLFIWAQTYREIFKSAFVYL